MVRGVSSGIKLMASSKIIQDSSFNPRRIDDLAVGVSVARHSRLITNSTAPH
jgi:hypothetical protein